MEDAALVSKTLDGDGRAFGALVARYQSTVYGYACHYLRDYAEAQDLAQDAFVEAYNRLGELRDPALFPAWLRGIALNFCRRRLRAKSRNAGSQPLEALADRGPSPEEALQQRERREGALQLLDTLSEKNRLVSTLYYLEDLSYEEIGRFLDLPVSTVKGRLHKSRQQLKQEAVNMVRQDFARHKLDARFADEVLHRAGLSAIHLNLESDHGVIWFSTEDDRHFAVSFPAATAQAIAQAPKPSLTDGLKGGMAIANDADELDGACETRQPPADMHQFALEAFGQFGIEVAGVVVDSEKDKSIIASALLERGDKTHAAPLSFADAVLLAGRSGAPVYATNRVCETMALDGGAGRTVPAEEVREFTAQSSAHQQGSELLYDAFDQRIDQVRIAPQDGGALVFFVKDGDQREVAELDGEAFEYMKTHVLFTKSDDEGHMHARRGDQAFTLNASAQGDELVLNIRAA